MMSGLITHFLFQMLTGFALVFLLDMATVRNAVIIQLFS